MCDLEKKIGIRFYSTNKQGIGGKIRTTMNDFIVEEILNQESRSELSPNLTDSHCYPVYLLEKSGIDTMHASQELEKVLHAKLHYLGLKDSKAVTSQYLCASKKTRNSPPEIIFKGNRARLVSYASRPLTRRSLLGNRFSIKIRELKLSSNTIKDTVNEVIDKALKLRIPNFYGYQRFGSHRTITHLAGRSIIAGRFNEAVEILLGENYDVKRTSDYKFLAENLPVGSDIERTLARSLSEKPDDYLLALRRLPLRFRRLLVSAYQSHLFNRVLSNAMNKNESLDHVKHDDFYTIYDRGDVSMKIRRFQGSSLEDVNSQRSIVLIPLVGYSFRLGTNRFGKFIEKELKEDDINPKQFYSREMPEVSAEGGFRPAPLLVHKMTWNLQEGKSSTIDINFTLNKGCYATILLREIMKPSDPLESGF